MPKCKYCGEEIETLINLQSGIMAYELSKDGNYEHNGEFETDDRINEFSYPKCWEVLFDDDEEEAVKFLKGE